MHGARHVASSPSIWAIDPVARRARDEVGRPRFAGPRDRHGRPLPAGSRDELAGRCDPEKQGWTTARAFDRAVQLFDEGRYFEAHECFEFVWKHADTPASRRPAWRAAAQVAVGLCHLQRGNPNGALRVLERAATTLERSEDGGVFDARALGRCARGAIDNLNRGGEIGSPSFPR